MRSEFDRRKAVGTAAEHGLRRLLTNAGALVISNQINRDATHAHAGAAIAHAADRTHHLPDLSVHWPDRTAMPRHGCEVKAKHPLRRGGWGWDQRAFDRAVRWNNLSGDAVLYVIRDLSAAPLPEPGEMDDPDCWWFASVWKLQNSPNRSTDTDHHYWPAEDFLPLQILLGGIDFSAAMVPFLSMRNGPPLLL